mmetsp:Transcript_26572/g.58243  ORF Transcript_26572/g.58243 Transcript_26572/m.58243 type:complete len:320 (-) Transcript_26572:12-971(-)
MADAAPAPRDRARDDAAERLDVVHPAGHRRRLQLAPRLRPAHAPRKRLHPARDGRLARADPDTAAPPLDATPLGHGHRRRARKRLGRVSRAAAHGTALHQLHGALRRHARLHFLHVRPPLGWWHPPDGRRSAGAREHCAALAALLVGPPAAFDRVPLQALRVAHHSHHETFAAQPCYTAAFQAPLVSFFLASNQPPRASPNGARVGRHQLVLLPQRPLLSQLPLNFPSFTARSAHLHELHSDLFSLRRAWPFTVDRRHCHPRPYDCTEELPCVLYATPGFSSLPGIVCSRCTFVMGLSFFYVHFEAPTLMPCAANNSVT